ncbi:MAG: haloacid dehalogenase type II [Acidiferrobacterales bacterium]|nr:haloacid dehalogenase type II [Acidiferrobacterales bacterium]
MTTLAFDVYGTLIDTAGVTTALRQHVGDNAVTFSNLWRQKQLEYTWRYGLMGHYQDFNICTQQALAYCCDQLECDISLADQKTLMDGYLELPAFNDVMDGLEALKSAGIEMYAFSNGRPTDLSALLDHAQITPYLSGVVSVHPKQTFKPNPVVYQHFVDSSGASREDCWLVSSNGFDVCGAVSVDMKAIWIQRNNAVKFDHWTQRPTKVIDSFSKLKNIFV